MSLGPWVSIFSELPKGRHPPWGSSMISGSHPRGAQSWEFDTRLRRSQGGWAPWSCDPSAMFRGQWYYHGVLFFKLWRKFNLAWTLRVSSVLQDTSCSSLQEKAGIYSMVRELFQRNIDRNKERPWKTIVLWWIKHAFDILWPSGNLTKLLNMALKMVINKYP